MTALTQLAQWSYPLLVLVGGSDGVPDDSEVRPGPMMAVVVLLIMAASVFLWFSLRKQLGKIQVPREDSESGAATEDREPADGDRPAGPPPVS
jgi:hypothetical protein